MPSLFCETDSETIKVTRVDYRAKKSEKCRGGTNEKISKNDIFALEKQTKES